MVKINKKISKYNNQSRNGSSVQYIVIHYVGAVSTAKNNADYFAGGNRNASAHFFVDESSIWQSVEESRAAWHCGGGYQDYGTKYGGGSFHGKCYNNNSIGIEMCVVKSGGKYVIKDGTAANTRDLVQSLMKKYNVPKSRVITHWNVTGKECPNCYWQGKLLKNGSGWTWFRDYLCGSTTTTKKSTTKKGYTGTFPTLPSGGALVYGSKGQQVKNLQAFLNWYGGYKLAVDGSFGPATLKAVKAYQKAEGLAVDGYFGPKSLAQAKKVKK